MNVVVMTEATADEIAPGLAAQDAMIEEETIVAMTAEMIAAVETTDTAETTETDATSAIEVTEAEMMTEDVATEALATTRSSLRRLHRFRPPTSGLVRRACQLKARRLCCLSSKASDKLYLVLSSFSMPMNTTFPVSFWKLKSLPV